MASPPRPFVTAARYLGEDGVRSRQAVTRDDMRKDDAQYMKKIPIDQEKKTIATSTWLGVVVAIFEIGMFILSGSQAILIDGVYDSMDVTILVIYQLLLPLIYKPISERIPYGFAQVETLFILIKGSVLIIITTLIIYDDIVIILQGGTSIDTKQVLVFEAFLTLFCIFGYITVRRLGRKLNTPMIRVELITWKIDVLLSLGAFIAFFMEIPFLHFHVLEWLVPYIDPLVSCIIAALMLPEPTKAFVNAIRGLVLMAPSEEKLERIRGICDEVLSDYPYEVDFLDVVRTGRKVWISLYFTTEGNTIKVPQLKRATEALKVAISAIYTDPYVELVPEIHPGSEEE